MVVSKRNTYKTLSKSDTLKLAQHGVLFVVGTVILYTALADASHAFDINIDLGDIFGGGNNNNGSSGGSNFPGAAGNPNSPEFNDAQIRNAVCQLLWLIEGSFGALLTTVAGIGAVVSSAFGAYRAGYSMIVVALSSFIMHSLVSLWFGTFNCTIVGGPGQPSGTGVTFGAGPLDVSVPLPGFDLENIFGGSSTRSLTGDFQSPSNFSVPAGSGANTGDSSLLNGIN